MEFQLPYLALRSASVKRDTRELRRRHEMLKRPGAATADLYYHEAQISFLLTGLDEWHWTAYCCVDTFFGSEQTPDEYITYQDDGPTGGARNDDLPAWNPREYFLIAFSRRMTQVTREWENIISVLSDRLDSDVRKPDKFQRMK
jgi:hypothetical protein